MENLNPLVKLLIDVETAYRNLAYCVCGPDARFWKCDPAVRERVKEAFDALHDAIANALDLPMHEELRKDLLELRGVLLPVWFGIDGVGLLRAAEGIDTPEIPGGDLYRTIMRRRLLLYSPGPAVTEDGSADPIAQVQLTERAAGLLKWLSRQKTAMTITGIRDSLRSEKIPCDTKAATGWAKELEDCKLIENLGRGRGFKVTPAGRKWLSL